MSQIAIIVEFQLKPGKQAEFEKLFRAHAERSLKEEKGCLRFDVLQPIDSDGLLIADCIWLTELYEDADAVKEHEDSPRMPILGEAIGSLVANKRLIKAALI